MMHEWKGLQKYYSMEPMNLIFFKEDAYLSVSAVMFS